LVTRMVTLLPGKLLLEERSERTGMKMPGQNGAS
jgi:hypothetical protein